MADEFEGWDEREAEERREQMRQQGYPTYEAAAIVRVLSANADLPEGCHPMPFTALGGLDGVRTRETAQGSTTIFGEAGEAEPLGEWDAGDDDQPIPPRGWLLGNSFCRGFVSSLLGEGGVGKTAMRYAQALSLATGRRLTGEHVFQRSRVLIVSLEDSRDEQRRRIQAARLHHGIRPDELRGWLYLAALDKAGGKLMTLDPH